MSGIRPRFKGHPNGLVRGFKKLYRISYEDPLRRTIRRRFIEREVRWESLGDAGGELHTLLCHRDVEMAIAAAMCYALAAQSRFNWIIHDDGSLTVNDVQLIGRLVPFARVIDRRSADARFEQEYRRFPKIGEYRRNQVMALKLVDVRIWAGSARIGYMDSDICFSAYPGIFLKALNGEIKGSLFNRDIQDAYVLDRKEIGRRLGVAPYPRVNAGLWVMDRDAIDLDTIEKWLNDPGLRDCLFAYTLDQTFVSMLGVLSSDGISHLPPEYDVDLLKPIEGSVSKHYVGAIRHGFELEGLRAVMATRNRA